MATTLDESNSAEALLFRIECGTASQLDMVNYIALKQQELIDTVAGISGTGTPTSTEHVLTSGIGNIPAGFQSVVIQLLAPFYDGSNEVIATMSSPSGFILSNNPLKGRFSVSVDAVDYGLRNKKLPAIAFSGTPTNIQWMGLSDNLT